ncbi:snaclec bitiscetin subunit alpha-like [Huso huso]|uniref:Snaclec bitiscetin subunit alpha-like n=1 Tax=Huso huso TaxID=61971 RepID=A0ABR0YZ63_HUSHU
MKVINRKSSLSNAESAVMGERGLLILLLAGFYVPAYNQIRKHVFVETEKSWSEAQSYCRENHTDLATVRSQEEAEQLLNITGASLRDSWIGLYRDDTQNWQWSNSDDVIYSNWRADVFCASVNSDGKWTDLPCHLQKAFMCYKGKDKIIAILQLIIHLFQFL